MIDDLITELNVTSSLCTLLNEHFDCKRFEDKTMDWYQLQRYTREYSDLLWTIQKKNKYGRTGIN